MKYSDLIQFEPIESVIQLRQADKADQLDAFGAALLGLKASTVLSRSDLDANPVCPHTGYRPVENPAPPVSASHVLASLEDRLDHLLDDWTEPCWRISPTRPSRTT